MAPGEGGLHPAQKPVRLMEALIDLVTIPGQTVIDPFAGSGTTGVAANKLGRNFILMESNPELCEVARKRIIQPKQQQLI